ncbi:putative toxin-antitoxin system toxin component, PIN family [Thioalkalivibrio paradoxus]|uniref:putative toxin-antitoxin system toxin component, PIN family n=1 Tax=Thioalkalivibrio paradoxus TaxID=108010 RepID=UPI00022C5BDA|nr:putative toxin-antitoxin system toxin component, PIN family [Thioalkalivibrio paradoxus]
MDTNVLLSGLMYPTSTPGRIVAAWRNAAFELVLTRAQLTEIARVLSYPKIARVLCWDPDQSERFLKQLYLRSVMVPLPESLPAEVPADPDDSPILSSLLVARAEYLVTGDSDLLALKDRYPILAPQAFVALL